MECIQYKKIKNKEYQSFFIVELIYTPVIINNVLITVIFVNGSFKKIAESTITINGTNW